MWEEMHGRRGLVLKDCGKRSGKKITAKWNEWVTPGVGPLPVILRPWTEFDADASFRPSYLHISAGRDRVMPSPDAGKVAKPMIPRSSD